MDNRVPMPPKDAGKETEDEIHVVEERRDIGRSRDFSLRGKGGYGVDNDQRC